MNKSIFIKIIIVLLILNVFFSPSSHAISNMMSDGQAFLTKGNSVGSTINTTVLKSTSDYIYNTLLAIAIIVAVIVAMVLGIQFMIASADEKAKVKEALMPFVAGCIVVFGSFTIWKVAIKIGNSAEQSKGPTIIIDREDGKPNDDGTLTFEVNGTDAEYIIPAE